MANDAGRHLGCVAGWLGGWRCGRCSALGWALALAATFMVSHFELVRPSPGVPGLARGKPHTHIGFHLRWLYRLVRHPLMLGFLIAFWATPTMTAGHLLFSIVMTGYILIATQLEEHDLVEVLGDEYSDYRRKVPGLSPRPPPAHDRSGPAELILEELGDAFQGRPNALLGQVGHRPAGDHRLLLVLRYVPGFAHQRAALGRAQLVTPDAAAQQTAECGGLPCDAAVGLVLDDGVGGAVWEESVSLRPRMAIPNFEPIESGTDFFEAWFTDSDRSKLAWLPASASSANISPAGALMTRSTLTVFPSIR